MAAEHKSMESEFKDGKHLREVCATFCSCSERLHQRVASIQEQSALSRALATVE
jgi:hypothetical protein